MARGDTDGRPGWLLGLVSVSWAWVGCYASSGPCEGDAPQCIDRASGACVAAVCREDGWSCPAGARPRCDEAGGCIECTPSERCGTGMLPNCYGVDEDGYCLDYAHPAECSESATGPRYRCPSGTMEASRCTWRSTPPPPTSSCTDLSPAACAAAANCVQTFDNQCCRACGGSTGPVPCADCEQWVPFDCLPREEACDPTAGRPCWRMVDGACAAASPVTPDCSMARPAGEGTCDVPGCILRSQPPCPDCIPTEECVPLSEQECEASCLEVAPDCGDTMTPEMRDGCFTGWCVHSRWCAASRTMPAGL